MGKREETQAEARAIYECDYDERAGRPTEIEARLASEVVALLRERDEARALAALVTTYREACAELTRAEAEVERCIRKSLRAWHLSTTALAVAQRAHAAALAALRETPAGEGGRC